MIKLKVKIIARNKLFDIDFRYEPQEQFLINGATCIGINGEDINEVMYVQGRGLILAACDNDMVLFNVSEAFFILEYELGVKLTKEHFNAMEIANKTSLGEIKDKKCH